MVSRIEAKLLEDPVANVMALKFLSLLGRVSQCRLVEHGNRWSTSFHYAPAQFPYDAGLYADRTRIVYWNANDRGAALELLPMLPPGSVVKVSTQPCLSLARERWPEVNAFVWFSSSISLPEPSGVEKFEHAAEDLVALSAENGYSREDLASQELRGCRWFLTRLEGVPQAICYVQPNYGSIWEISGVYTRAGFRGRGLAKAVTAAAVNDLVARGLTPRYFVHDQNQASLGVARGLGLEERGRTRHFALS